MPPAARTVAVRAHIHRRSALAAWRCFHASGHCARDASAADVLDGRELAGDEAALAGRSRSAAWSRSHCPATTASWCSPSTSCTLGDRARRSASRRLPTAGATASAAYRARLARMRTACSSASGGSSPRSSTASRSFFHGLPHEVARARASKSSRSADGGHGACRGDEPVEQRDVAVGAHRRRAARRARASRCVAQAVEQLLARVASDGGSVGEPAVEPVEQHVGVAHRAEQAAQPLQLVAQRARPTPGRRPRGTCAGRSAAGGSRRGPGARLRGRSPRRTPGSWASRRAVERDDRGARAPRWASTRSRASAARRGRGRRARGARGPARSSGRCSGCAGAGVAQPVGDRARRASAAASSANSTSSSRKRAVEAHAVEHRHLVVDDLGDELRRRRRAARRVWRTVLRRAASCERRVAERARARGRRRRRAARRRRRRRAARCGRARRRTRPGSFTVQPSSLRWRRLAPARASRRSAVSK